MNSPTYSPGLPVTWKFRKWDFDGGSSSYFAAFSKPTTSPSSPFLRSMLTSLMLHYCHRDVCHWKGNGCSAVKWSQQLFGWPTMWGVVLIWSIISICIHTQNFSLHCWAFSFIPVWTWPQAPCLFLLWCVDTSVWSVTINKTLKLKVPETLYIFYDLLCSAEIELQELWQWLNFLSFVKRALRATGCQSDSMALVGLCPWLLGQLSV